MTFVMCLVYRGQSFKTPSKKLVEMQGVIFTIFSELDVLIISNQRSRLISDIVS